MNGWRARRWVVAALAGSVVASLAPVGVVAAAGRSHATAPTMYYVSLGDSYAIGYQPDAPGTGGTSGYTGYVAKKLHLQLENFGCGGATTASILTSIGCGDPAATDAVAYPTTTQAAAAEAFITAHPGQIGLITVSIGGNDVTACAAAADPISCVTGVESTIAANVTTLADGLRSAAGPGVTLVGLTYPDVILGQWVFPPVNQTLAEESVSAFHLLINPTLRQAYTGAGAAGSFVDVTQHTGAYIPLTKTTHLKPYGKIPVAVAKVCELTWYCSEGNIHANTTGYKLIGKLIVKDVKSLPPGG